ncbi:hypothetical protein ACFXP7_02095 [Microbacterium sp. P06]|uniref:hypothetical protein n=1 Tax=Microbacterium sp. P06 TaxID=3366949 RepID=UPI0037457652
MTGLGWYVHHHGRGHLTRFEAVRPHVIGPVVVFSSLDAPTDLPEDTRWVVLPRDDAPYDRAGRRVDPQSADPTVGGLLHWAPLGHPGHRQRLAAIAAASVSHDLDAFVVDVSVEVALWVRLLGLPTVVVAQPGERTDGVHALAYRAADRIIAPWPRALVPSAALEEFGDRVEWIGGVSRFADRVVVARRDERSVLILGQALPGEALARARDEAEAAGWTMTVVGADAAPWQADPWDQLCAATVVVSAAGQNSVADIAAARARALVIAQDRPFGEQAATAEALDRARLAVSTPVPQPGGLVPLLERARMLEPEWSTWQVAGAPARAAAAIASVVR